MSLITSYSSIIKQGTACLTIFRYYPKPSVPNAVKKQKKLGKLGPIAEKVVIPVETDAHKLVNYVCGSNFSQTGEDINTKDDSEYPEWLWKINVGPAPKLEELDPGTKQYWRKLRTLALRRNNTLSKLKKF